MAREWLEQIRKEKGLTMREVAAKSGIAECYYSQIENGKRNLPVNTAKAIASALDFEWQKFYE